MPLQIRSPDPTLATDRIAGLVVPPRPEGRFGSACARSIAWNAASGVDAAQAPRFVVGARGIADQRR